MVWGIPALVILFLGGVIWIGSHRLDPFSPIPSSRPPLDVQVVSLDWKWLFIYPDQESPASTELVVPAGVPVHFRLTSASVMNAFFVPQLGSMVATMNGMETQLYLQADRPGDYLRPVDAIQRRRLFRHALHAATRCRQTISSTGSPRRGKRGPALDRAGVRDAGAPELRTSARHLPLRRPGPVPGYRDAAIPPGPGPQEPADRRTVPAAIRRRGRLSRCSAS